MADMYANNNQNGSCLLIDRFNLLISHLNSSQSDSDALRLLVTNIAKFNNKFNTADKYMRTFAKVVMRGTETQHIAQKLEILLNTEIAIKKRD